MGLEGPIVGYHWFAKARGIRESLGAPLGLLHRRPHPSLRSKLTLLQKKANELDNVVLKYKVLATKKEEFAPKYETLLKAQEVLTQFVTSFAITSSARTSQTRRRLWKTSQ